MKFSTTRLSGMNISHSITIRAFITRVNSPSVSKFTGNDNIFTNGFTNVLSNPSTTEVRIAPLIPIMAMPGTKNAATYTVIVNKILSMISYDFPFFVFLVNYTKLQFFLKFISHNSSFYHFILLILSSNTNFLKKLY